MTSPTPQRQTRQPALGFRRSWQLLVALLVPIFLGACASSPRTVRWMDPDFASGKIPISHLEMLPISVAFNIDGVGATAWKELQRRHKQLAMQLDGALRQSLTANQYKVARGYMSRERFYHLLQQVNKAAHVGTRVRRPVGVDPVLVAGGIPGTDAVLVVQGYANLTTGGKRAAQAAVVTLIVLTVVVIVAAMIYALSKSKSGKSSKSGKRSSRLRARSSRVRSGSRYRYRRGTRNYRRRYFRRRSGRRITRGARYYRGRYRYRGRWRRYRVLRFRRAVATSLLFYLPHHVDNGPPPSHAPNHKQPFFSGSYLDLSISMVEKGTGLLLWHHFKRWGIDPSNPGQLRQTIHKLVGNLPVAQRLKRSMMPPPGPQGTPQGQPQGTPQGQPPKGPAPTMQPAYTTQGQPAKAPPALPPAAPHDPKKTPKNKKEPTKKAPPARRKPTKEPQEPLDPTDM